MKDEIKEILESLDKISKAEYYPEDLLTYKECHLLLDYITNLQEENKELKELEHDYRVELKLTARYEKRIDKAIEFINYKWQKEKYYQNIENCIEFCEFDRNDLLNILQGE